MMSEVLVEFEIRSRGKHQGIKGGQGSWERVSFSFLSILLALLPSPSKSNAVVRNAPIVRSNVLDVEAEVECSGEECPLCWAKCPGCGGRWQVQTGRMHV